MNYENSPEQKRSVLYVFINLCCTESVCLFYGFHVYGQKYINIIIKYSFALAHSEVRTKPYIYFHKLAYITSHPVCEKKTA